ncbi:IS5 family transposase [Vibrio splendidus]|uniref:IS5 family transposase n=1 Tax=Vibrio splendidus TaxID=29497 RepID=UPI002236A548|nr:IS5 family transposase [Vibrio splendidus]MCW4446364.1 IS5 family transposase [Vibrio splendidus]
MGKAKKKITNWAEYNKALGKRGSVTFWIDDSAIDAWKCKTHHGKRGRGFQYSDTAIETALMIKGIFSLPLRALQGFIDSIFELLNVPLTSPDYTCISKRSKTVQVKYRNKSRGAIRHIAIDSTGLKVFGEREWKVKKHGVEKRRTWRKLHLDVDVDTHEAIGAEVSLVSVDDSEVLPTLLNPLRRKILTVSANGAYDTKICYKTLKNKGCTPPIPPRKNAALWKDGHPRNEIVEVLKNGTIAEWKSESGYHYGSISETAMSRYKGLTNGKLSLRCYNAQMGEIMANVKAINKVIGLDMPIRS